MIKLKRMGKIMKKTIFLLSYLTVFAIGQSYYNVDIENTGVSQLVIFQNSISSLISGDEVGIFDENGITNSEDCLSQTGELLVGSGLWSD